MSKINKNKRLRQSIIFFSMKTFSLSIKPIRKASTHLTKEPEKAACFISHALTDNLFKTHLLTQTGN